MLTDSPPADRGDSHPVRGGAPSPTPADRRKRWAGVQLVMPVTWVLAIGLSFAVLLDYEYRRGAPATAPAALPTDRETALGRADGVPSLVLFVHPRCPCTRATMEQLDRILRGVDPGSFAVRVVFFQPADAPDEFHRTDLWEHAGRLGAARIVDEDGRIARRFGVKTSGQALVYDGEGRLRFAGGLTATRGHAGDNPSSAAVLDLARRREPGVDVGPVFGCDLLGRSAP